MALIAAIANYKDPLIYKEAMELEFTNEWQEACQYEMNALAKNGTWKSVNLPLGQKAIKLKCVKALVGLICLMGPKSRLRGTWN